MTNQVLDNLVNDGQISEYVYKEVNDTNRNNDNLYYQILTITFPNGSQINIRSDNNGNLNII